MNPILVCAGTAVIHGASSPIAVRYFFVVNYRYKIQGFRNIPGCRCVSAADISRWKGPNPKSHHS